MVDDSINRPAFTGDVCIMATRMTQADMDSETTRAANAVDTWELPKASLEAKRAALKFYNAGDNRKFWFWMYYSKIMKRIRNGEVT